MEKKIRRLAARCAAVLSALALCAGLAGCSAKNDGEPRKADDGTLAANVDVLQFRTPADDALVAVFDTAKGEFSAQLFPSAAPQAVQNFVTLARSGAYDGLDFNRVISHFLIQSGDTDGAGGQSMWGTGFPHESSDLLHHYTGALAMAGGDDNRSQFFVVDTETDSVPEVLRQQMQQLGWDENVISAYSEVGGAPYLDNAYTVFGQVFYGMDTVGQINTVKTDSADVPEEAVKLNSVRIMSYAEWRTAHADASPRFYKPAESDASASAASGSETAASTSETAVSGSESAAPAADSVSSSAG